MMAVSPPCARLRRYGAESGPLPQRRLDAPLLVSRGLPAFRDGVGSVPRQPRSAPELGDCQSSLLDAFAQDGRASLVLLVPKLDPLLHRNGSTSCVPSIPARRVLVIQERLSYTHCNTETRQEKHGKTEVPFAEDVDRQRTPDIPRASPDGGRVSGLRLRLT